MPGGWVLLDLTENKLGLLAVMAISHGPSREGKGGGGSGKFPGDPSLVYMAGIFFNQVLFQSGHHVFTAGPHLCEILNVPLAIIQVIIKLCTVYQKACLARYSSYIAICLIAFSL